jgi:hypothetical protein
MEPSAEWGLYRAAGFCVRVYWADGDCDDDYERDARTDFVDVCRNSCSNLISLKTIRPA